MLDLTSIYARLRESEMNAWVGGADPELVGDFCADILLRHVPIGDQTALLDFGAGIGRVALGVLKRRPTVRSITGIDIVPKMVSFCREVITPEIANLRFELLADANAHYDRYKDGGAAKTRTDLTMEFGETFDAAYAYSVFTHVDTDDFCPLLRFVGTLLKPGGYFLFTAFSLTPYSRAMLDLGRTEPSFSDRAFEQNGDVFVGNPTDRLAFIAYDGRLIERMVWEAGLIPTAIEYGEWRSGGFMPSYQDIFVCRKPL